MYCSNRLPVPNIGDGVSLKVKVSQVLRDLLGFMSPDFSFSAHASGSFKRLATSKAMNVSEVTNLCECLRTVIKHFESSVKNRETLAQCI